MTSKHLVLVFIFFVAMAITASALDESERAYFEGLNQKSTAQLYAKIETEAQKLDTSFDQKNQALVDGVQTMVDRSVKSRLIAVCLGLGGIIVITNAIFKIIELRLSMTRKIKRYEEQLQKDMANLSVLRQNLTNYQKQLDSYRDQLIKLEHEKKLKAGMPPTLSAPSNRGALIFRAAAVICVLLAIGVAVFGYLRYVQVK